MTEEEKKVVEYFKKSFESKTPPYWYDDTIENSEIKIKTLVNLIEKLQSKINKRDNEIIEFNTSGIKCKNKDIHCPTSKETLDYYENFLIPGYEEEIKKLQKENEELRHSYDIATTKTEELKKKLGLKQFDVNVVYNDYLEKLREFKSNSIPKDKIRKIIEKLKNEEKALRKDFEKHRVQLFELYKKVVLIEGYKKLLEEE